MVSNENSSAWNFFRLDFHTPTNSLLYSHSNLLHHARIVHIHVCGLERLCAYQQLQNRPTSEGQSSQLQQLKTQLDMEKEKGKKAHRLLVGSACAAIASLKDRMAWDSNRDGYVVWGDVYDLDLDDTMRRYDCDIYFGTLGEMCWFGFFCTFASVRAGQGSESFARSDRSGREGSRSKRCHCFARVFFLPTDTQPTDQPTF